MTKNKKHERISINGFSRGIEHFETTTTASAWERKAIRRGTLAAAFAALATATFVVAGNSAILLAAGVAFGYLVTRYLNSIHPYNGEK